MDVTSSQVVALMTAISHVVNPYQQLSKLLHKLQYEMMYPPQLSRVLLTVIVVHFLLFVQSAASLSLKAFLKKHRKRRLWLWKRLYCGEHQTIPFYVPNGEFAIEISQLFGCCCFVIFGFIAYTVLKNPEAAGATQQFLWMAVSFAPGFIGSWLYGFSAIYVVFFTPGQSERFNNGKKIWIRNPTLMNSFCIVTPIIIGLTFTSLGFGVDVLHTRERQSYRSLQTLLNSLSAQWNSGDTDPAKIQTLLPALDALRNDVNAFFKLCRVTCYCWAVVSLIFAIFYCATTVAICKSLKFTSNVASGKTALLSGPDWKEANGTEAIALETCKKAQDSPKIASRTAPNNDLANKLHSSYQLLACHCAMIALSLLWYFTASLVLATNFDKAEAEPYWRAACIWLVASSALFISGALCAQSVWSIVANREPKPRLPAPDYPSQTINSVIFQAQSEKSTAQRETVNSRLGGEAMKNGLGGHLLMVSDSTVVLPLPY